MYLMDWPAYRYSLYWSRSGRVFFSGTVAARNSGRLAALPGTTAGKAIEALVQVQCLRQRSMPVLLMAYGSVIHQYKIHKKN